MARADLILSLIRAGTKGDQPLFRKAAEAIISEERAKQHHVLADQLAEAIKTNAAPERPVLTQQNGLAGDLYYEISPRRKLVDLVLPAVVCRICQELVEEQHRHELLASHGLEPRNRVLLVGPPGNGKTSLAEGIAEALMVPLLSARYEGLIGSYLGETAATFLEWNGSLSGKRMKLPPTQISLIRNIHPAFFLPGSISLCPTRGQYRN